MNKIKVYIASPYTIGDPAENLNIPVFYSLDGINDYYHNNIRDHKDD
jgi:hypothetical protein